MTAVILIRDGQIARLLERQLKALRSDCAVVILKEPGKALRHLEDTPADAVFLDIDGEADWQGVCGMVKVAARNTSLVLLSDDSLNAVKAFEAGAADFITKPVEHKRLEQAVLRCARVG